MSILDFSPLADDQLVELIRAALQEAVRRGSAVEAAARDAGLEEAEKARIARAAAEREAERLRQEEAARVAREAAEKVRRDAERAKEQEAIDERAKIRAIAARARELWGSGWSEFTVQVWDRKGDRRVFVQADFDRKFTTYYHTGNERIAPGTLAEDARWPVECLAEHLGIPEDEARGKIKEFCAGLCRDWKGLKVEVNESNAPCDPAAKSDYYILKAALSGSHQRFGHKYEGREDWYCIKADDADRFPTREAALAAIPEYVGEHGMHLASRADNVLVERREKRLAFPPKEAAHVVA
jgi:hypothetical protein